MHLFDFSSETMIHILIHTLTFFPEKLVKFVGNPVFV